MLYSLIKIPIRLALTIFCRSIVVRNRQLLQTKGPLLIAANHPNALLDAIIIGAMFKEPVHFLTRGDVFNKAWKRKLLFMLNMVPIYRIRDGYQSLHLNQYAFDKCHAILKNNGIVLVFIEGACKHTHELQPLKKGTARIAFKCWRENIPLQVMPVTVRYSSLFKFGKDVLLNVQPELNNKQLTVGNDDAKNYLHFNKAMETKLSAMLEWKEEQKHKTNLAFLILGFIGKLLNTPLYYPIKSITVQKTKGNEFHDSVLFGLLFFTYQLYWLFLMAIATLFTNNILFLAIIAFTVPFTAWCAVRSKQ